MGLLATPQNPIPTPFTWHLLGKLQYLQAVIREGLRLFSPAANGSFRFNAAADLQLREDLVVPKVGCHDCRIYSCPTEKAHTCTCVCIS